MSNEGLTEYPQPNLTFSSSVLSGNYVEIQMEKNTSCFILHHPSLLFNVLAETSECTDHRLCAASRPCR
jgi:hypothetical protein